MRKATDATSIYQVVDRLLALRDLLRAEPHTREQIFTRLPEHYSDAASEASRDRKLRRDLRYLERWGYRKVYNAAEKAYALAVSRLEADWSESEIAALAALRASFVEGAPYADTLQALLSRIAGGLNERQRKAYARKPSLTIKFAATGEQFSAAATREKIADALRRHQRIRFRYTPSDRPRVIYHPDDEPIQMVFDDGHYYLWAYCYKMSRIYKFRADMVVPDSVEILPKRAEGRWKPQLVYFQYWLSPKIAERGISPRFPEMDYDVEKGGRGGVIVSAGAYSEFDAIQGILRYGEQAEILSPDSLRAKMRRVVEQMAGLYGRVVG